MLLLIAIAFVITGCGLSESFMRGQRMPNNADNALMVFGGPNRNIYLGNISLDPGNADSIYNKNGKYGDPSSELSISNKKGDYGSTTSALSACNPDATNPPVLIDRYNTVLGEFTLNETFKSNLPVRMIDALRKLCKTH